MAAKINLLPPELAGSKTIIKAGRILNIFAASAIAIFFIVASLGVFSIYVFTNELNDLTTQSDTLKTTIRSLEGVESRLVLIKDRVEKVQRVLADRKNEETFNKQKEIVDNMPASFTFEEAEIEGEKSILGIVSTSSSGMVELFNRILSQNFVRLALNSIDFNQFAGYKVSLEVF